METQQKEPDKVYMYSSDFREEIWNPISLQKYKFVAAEQLIARITESCI